MLSADANFTLGFISMPGGYEWIILVVIGLLLFGKRLPGIARSLGQSVVEFKKGIKGVQDDISESASKPDAPKSEPAKIEHAPQGTIDVSAQSRPAQAAPAAAPAATPAPAESQANTGVSDSTVPSPDHSQQA